MFSQRTGSQVESFGRTLTELGSEYENLVVLDPDVALSTGATFFAERFPERFFSVGISEQDLIGVAAGLASAGKIPVPCGFALFITGRAWEQVANSVARPCLNVKLVGTHSGLSPHADGDSHQTFWDVAMMRVLPNMKVVIPADSVETVEAVRNLISVSGPAYLRLSRGSTPIVYADNSEYTLGKARIIREGADATIISNGTMVKLSIDASELLKKDGFDVGVIDMHTVKPLDEDIILKKAKETGFIVTAEEHSIYGGLGGAVAEVLSEKHPIPMRMVGIRDRFGQSSRDYSEILQYYGLTSVAIVKTIHTMIDKNSMESY